MEMNMLRKALWEILRPLITTITLILNPEKGEEALRELKKFNRKEPCWVRGVSKFFRQLFADEETMLDATTGQEILAASKSVFDGGISSDFKVYGTDKPSRPTKAMPVQVFEQIEKATFFQMFGSFGRNLDDLCLTQGQIRNFCRKHRAKLRAEGGITLFLFKVGEAYFVAYVYCDGAGRLGAHVYRLSFDGVWDAEHRNRLVLPQSL